MVFQLYIYTYIGIFLVNMYKIYISRKLIYCYELPKYSDYNILWCFLVLYKGNFFSQKYFTLCKA